MTAIGYFKGYKVYGPYMSKAEQRRMVTLVRDDHRTTMSYARYIMCRDQDRWLGPDEVVDHIDNDQLHDELENLQILTQAENTRKSAPPIQMITLACGYCMASFTRESRQVLHKKDRKQAPCCSRSCAAKLQFAR